METEFIRIYAWAKLWILSPLKEYALSFFERRKLEIWMLLQLYPNLRYDKNFSTFVIPNLLMPEVIKQSYSRLLVYLPVKNDKDSNLIYPNVPPDTFYLDAGLQDQNDNYVMNILRGTNVNFELFNDMQEEGYGRFPLAINKWQPSWDIISGDNLIDLVNKIVYNVSLFGR